MYSIDRNQKIRKTLEEKWNKYSTAKEEYDHIFNKPEAYPEKGDYAWGLYLYTSAVLSEESITGDIRVIMKSLYSFPDKENIAFWKNHISKCANCIISSSPNGYMDAVDMVIIMQREVKRLFNTIDFRADTELLSEDKIAVITDPIRDIFDTQTSYVFDNVRAMSTLFSGRVNRNKDLNRLNQFNPFEPVTPIAYGTNGYSLSESSCDIAIPFDRTIPFKYLVTRKSHTNN